MKKADIKVGFSCNNRCLFCVQGDKRFQVVDKTDEEVKGNIRKARSSCDIVTFTGGEPTLRKGLVDFIRLAAELRFKTIQIQTNGRMFAYLDYCKSLIAAGANEFSPALHGHVPELHDYLTNAPGSFRQVVAGIKNLKSLGQRVITNTVITKPNYRHLPEIARLLSGLKVDQFQFAFVHATGSARKNFDSIVPRKTLVEPYLKEALAVGIKNGISVMAEAMPFCFMAGFEDQVSERIMPEMAIFDEHGHLPDFKKSRLAEGKAKGSACRKCKYDAVCEGPWKEYPERYGWSEFEPITV